MFTKLVDYEKFIQKPRFTIDKNLWKNPSQKDLVESHRCYYLENMHVTCVITWSAHIHDLSTYKYRYTLEKICRISWVWNATRNSTPTLKYAQVHALVRSRSKRYVRA